MYNRVMGNQTILYFISLIKNSKELKRKEKDILIKRIKNNPLHKIGKKYKLSAERVRQIEERAIFKFLKKACQLMLFD